MTDRKDYLTLWKDGDFTMYLEVKDPEGYIIETFAVNPINYNKIRSQVRKIYPFSKKYKINLIEDEQ